MDSQQKFYLDEEYFSNRPKKEYSKEVLKLIKLWEQLKPEDKSDFNIALRDKNIF